MNNKLKSSKKLSAIIVMVAILVNSVSSFGTAQVASQFPFDILKEKTTGYSDIVELIEAEIVKGYPDGTFQPNENISRKQVAVLLANALNLSIPNDLEEILSTYDDVSTNHPYAKEIAAVTKANIFKGTNNKFLPESNITRNQMATVLVLGFELLANDNLTVDFADINNIYEGHRENVKILAQHGITIGKPNGNGSRYFDGGSNLTRAQFAVFLNRSLKKKFRVVNIF